MKRSGFYEPPLTSFRLDNLIANMVYDLRATREIAPELPVAIDDGVARTVRWLAQRGEVPQGQRAV